ncbi:MAG TPA: M56 family metallopeptidase [Sedimentisphaerales bacterium]|nr:M56 family metallopeptidase [Sedimentisphaerales bacterium]
MKLVPVFDWLLRTTLQAALLLCLILLIQLILRGRLPIRWRYYLWLLLLIRMATPWLPESRISIFNWVPRAIQEGGIIEPLLQPQDAPRGMGFYSRAGVAKAQEAETETPFVRFARIVPLLWLAGGLALAVYVGACNFHLWWLVTRERPLTNQKVLDLLEDCKAEMGIRNILGIVTTDKVKTAALFGFVRPRLLLPAGMIETLSLKELRYIFLHELGHLRRRDIYVGWLMSLLQVLHWFNPLVWFAFYRMQSDRELACDALVLSYARSDELKDYGRTIVSLLERFSRPQRLPSMAGILETKSQLKRRIKMIAKFKKTSRPRWAGAMLLVAALACVVLTNAYVAKADFEFGEPVNLGPTINSGYDDGGPFISADGLSLFFDSSRPGGLGRGDLWVATRATTDDDWGMPVNLGPIINSAYEDWEPCVSADGLELYFDSERPGGYGSFDIYMATRATQDDPWGIPQNLGSTINTSRGEGGASISADGLSLYFNLYGAGGSGDYDIWVTTRKTKADPWGQPVNLGPAVNSRVYDGVATVSDDGLLLVFAADARPGGYGTWDLWLATRTETGQQWSEARNLGGQVNTVYGECSPSLSANGHFLYFCDYPSPRPGGCGGVDIWQASILPVVDFNGDGIVDCVDICMLVDRWETNDPLYDIAPAPSGDGIVDVQDLIVLTEHLTPKQADPNALTP